MIKKMKWFVTGFAAALVLTLSTGVYAAGYLKNIQINDDPIKININGTAANVPNFIYNGRTYIQLRSVSELYGLNVAWDGSARTANITGKNTADSSGTVSDLSKLSSQATTVQDIAKNDDAVVMIKTYDGSGVMTAIGSGFIVTPDGEVATNYHVVKDASTLQAVTINNRTYDAYVVKYDANKDLAVIKLESAVGMPVVKLGDSSMLRLGDPVVAIGNPEGLQGVVSEGIVSTVDRFIGGQDYIQITAPISPGSSGGALFDSSGKVVGITAAVLSEGQSLNFAVPVNYIKPLLN